jgi:hypothetical protein
MRDHGGTEGHRETRRRQILSHRCIQMKMQRNSTAAVARCEEKTSESCLYLCPSMFICRPHFTFAFLLLRVPLCHSVSPWFGFAFLPSLASHQKRPLSESRLARLEEFLYLPCEPEPTRCEGDCASISRQRLALRGLGNVGTHALSESPLEQGLGNLKLWQDATHDALRMSSACF